MPKYSYKCKECGHQFDARQRMSDDPLTECPVCGGEVRRVVGSVGIVFKGKGFYVTDHRNGSGRVKTSEKSDKSGQSSDAKESSDSPKKKDKGSDAAKSSASSTAAASSPG